MLNIYVLIFLFSVFIASASQILLKKSANQEHGSFIKEYLNWRVIIAYGLLFLSSFVTIIAYKGVPYSMGPVLEATGYIWVAVLGYFILKEKIGKKKLLGLVFIILGVIVSGI